MCSSPTALIPTKNTKEKLAGDIPASVKSLKLAHHAEVETLYLFHHDPDQNDDAIDAKLEMAARALESMRSKTKCVAPAETDVVKL